MEWRGPKRSAQIPIFSNTTKNNGCSRVPFHTAILSGIFKRSVNKILTDTHTSSTEQRKIFRYKGDTESFPGKKCHWHVAKRPVPWGRRDSAPAWPHDLSTCFHRSVQLPVSQFQTYLCQKQDSTLKKRGREREKLEERNYPNNLCRNAQFRTHTS